MGGPDGGSKGRDQREGSGGPDPSLNSERISVCK